MRACVLHGHELVQVIAIERPSVYHLLTMGIDHQDVPSARHVNRFAPLRRYLNRGSVHSVSSSDLKTLIRPADGMRSGACDHPQCQCEWPRGKVAFGSRTKLNWAACS